MTEEQNKLADRLQAMLDQVGHPDYSLRELYEGLKLIVWELREREPATDAVLEEAAKLCAPWESDDNPRRIPMDGDLLAAAIRALSPARVAEDVPSADEVPHFWMGHRDKEPSTEEMLRVSDALVQAVNEDYWKDAVVQWPQHFLHTKECNVHEPALSLCSCGLETRLKDEILRLQHRLYEVAEEKAVHENDGEKLKVEKYYRDVGALRPASCGCYPEGNPGDCPAPGCSRSGG